MSLTLNEKLQTATDILENIFGCFTKRNGRWYEHKSNDGEWVEVSEDLQDYLEETEEFLDAHVRVY